MRSAGSVAVSSKRADHKSDLAAARRVITFAGDAIRDLGEALNGDFSRAIDTILGIKGRVVVSGMGKSGHIGNKIAATLASTGTPAFFIHPAEASHGDLGMVTRADALLMLSNSGETAELSDLITHAKRIQIPLIGIASRPESALMHAADVPLVLPKSREACPMGLAPTTSTTLMLVLGDALAVALMERRGFSTDQYRDLHPAGALGKALIRVSDLMHSGDEMPLVSESTAMKELVLVLAKKRYGCVGIVDRKGGLVGIVTDGDLGRHMDRELLDRTPAEIMTRDPKVIAPGALAAEALALMNAKNITQLFVLDPKGKNKKPLGILHMHDCVRAGIQ
ncbi:MAG TPA: KpsF/GutQ family sugar-phosphate isomerase [Rhizomicrobium sp.]|jgi:arabinose-5-phosphate isomerase|nr:KpsF/GutQ family sugar-phosphate isomerase [Rhizomicrobium sp.]